MTVLLVFLDAYGDHWLRLDAGVVTARGSDLAALPRPDGAAIIAVVPGEDVVLHWVQLPPLAPAQAAAAARLLAADVSAGAIDATHVAVGPATTPDMCLIALVANETIAGWLARLESFAIDPDRILPAPLLLPMPAAGVAVHDAGSQWLVRGPDLAFAAEPALAAMMVGDAPVTAIDTAAFEAGLAAALATPGLDLRQGMFARARPWRIDAQRLRQLALLCAALFAAVLATNAAALLRHQFAADRAELQVMDSARAVLPRGTIVTDPAPQVAARLAALGGAGTGFSPLTGALLTAMRDRPQVTLYSLEFSAGNALVAVLSAPAAADREALAAALAQSGVNAAMGAPLEQDGQSRTELRITPQ